MKGGRGCGRHGGAEAPSRKDLLPIQAQPQLLRAPQPCPPLLGGPYLVAESLSGLHFNLTPPSVHSCSPPTPSFQSD